MITQHSKDPVVEAIVSKFRTRSEAGMNSYGQTMADNPKPLLAWIDDAQEELMDAILYLERIRGSLEK